MKKTFLITSAVALFLSVFAACNGKGVKTETDTAMNVDSVVVDTIVKLSPADKNTPTCHVSINLKYTKGTYASAMNDTILGMGMFTTGTMADEVYKGDVKKAVARFVERFTNQYKKDCLPIYKADKTSMACNYEYTLKTSILPGKQDGQADIMPYVAESYLYLGGANGLDSKFVRNFDLKTGKVITRAEAVPKSKEKTLTGLIVKYLAKANKVKTLADLKELGYFMDGEPYVPQTFIIGRDSITFVYNEMEMAPHALGEIDAKVAYKDFQK